MQFPLQSVSPIRKLPWATYPYSAGGRQTENHNHRKLTNLITWTTAFSNSVELWAMPCRDTQDGHGGEFWQNVVHWRREWHTTSVFLPWKPMNSMKRQKDKTLKDELPRSVGAKYAIGDQWRNNIRKNADMEPKQKQYPVVDVKKGDGSKIWCCKEKYCIGTC